MTSNQIQEMITVEEWGMWLQYVKKNNIKNEGGQWPNYDFHEFYTSLGLKEIEGEQAISQGRSDTSRSEPVVPTNVPEGDGLGREVVIHPDDNVTGGRSSHDDQLPLQGISDGPSFF